MKFQYDLYNPSEFRGTLIVPFHGTESLRAIAGRISPEIAPETIDIPSDSEEVRSLITVNRKIDAVPARTLNVNDWQRAMQSYMAKRSRELGRAVHIYLEHLVEEPELLEASVRGLVLGTYDHGLYKSSSDGKPGMVEATLYCPDTLLASVQKAIATSETQKEIFKLVNAPSNHKDPNTLAEWAIESGARYNYKVTVIGIDKLRELGFEGLLAVNRGSEIPAKFIICDYHPDGAEKSVALIGKGVTFDTGGISLKPSNNMHYMKSDMGGAAAVLGAVELVAKLGTPVRVMAFVPTTDNSIGTAAIKPGDVIGSYSGKTIEVLNTDAEGRLILADALSYSAKKFAPDYMIDLATLTGSVVRALGNHCAGLFTANDDLADKLIRAGEETGERLWRLPLWDVYGEDMRSDIADIKNLSDKPIAGSITAAKFLEEFTEGHSRWAHIDIAGVAFKGNGTSKSYSATAFGVQLLHAFVESLSK